MIVVIMEKEHKEKKEHTEQEEHTTPEKKKSVPKSKHKKHAGTRIKIEEQKIPEWKDYRTYLLIAMILGIIITIYAIQKVKAGINHMQSQPVKLAVDENVLNSENGDNATKNNENKVRIEEKSGKYSRAIELVAPDG